MPISTEKLLRERGGAGSRGGKPQCSPEAVVRESSRGGDTESYSSTVGSRGIPRRRNAIHKILKFRHVVSRRRERGVRFRNSARDLSARRSRVVDDASVYISTCILAVVSSSATLTQGYKRRHVRGNVARMRNAPCVTGSARNFSAEDREKEERERESGFRVGISART